MTKFGDKIWNQVISIKSCLRQLQSKTHRPFKYGQAYDAIVRTQQMHGLQASILIGNEATHFCAIIKRQRKYEMPEYSKIQSYA